MKHFHFEDCSHETVLTEEMKVMIPPETEEVHLSSCRLIQSIPGHFCHGLSKLEGLVIVNITIITNTTFAGLDCLKYLSINFSDSNKLTIEHGSFDGLKMLKRLYLNGISKLAIPEDLLDGHFQLVVDGVEIQGASSDDDVTTVEGRSVSDYAQRGCATSYWWLPESCLRIHLHLATTTWIFHVVGLTSDLVRNGLPMLLFTYDDRKSMR